MRLADFKCELLIQSASCKSNVRVASKNAGKKCGLKILKRNAKMQDVSCNVKMKV